MQYDRKNLPNNNEIIIEMKFFFIKPSSWNNEVLSHTSVIVRNRLPRVTRALPLSRYASCGQRRQRVSNLKHTPAASLHQAPPPILSHLKMPHPHFKAEEVAPFASAATATERNSRAQKIIAVILRGIFVEVFFFCIRSFSVIVFLH